MLTETIFTSDHLDRLLDLCKRLFPEYDPEMMYQFPANQSEKMRFGKIWFYTRDKKFVAGIHWYELCLTYLFDRMVGDEFDRMHKGRYDYHWNLFMRALKSDFHPVDYLERMSKILKT